jgi:hypothetical protein
MTWRRAPVAAAIAAALETIDPSVAVFASPPETFNAPAYVVGYARRVDYRQHQFGSDVGQLPMFAACGLAETDRVDTMLTQAYDTLTTVTDATFGGIVQLVDAGPQDNWRLLRVGGVDLVAADLLLTITM